MSLPNRESKSSMKGRYIKDDILKALKDVGIERGSTVYVSSSLGLIGYPPHDINSVDQLCELFYSSIWEAIGESGTLIVPTYSYTFSKGTGVKPAVFDLQTTPSDIGNFPNFILKQDGVRRSRDPMLSVAGKGRRLHEFTDNLPPASYTEGSFLSRLAHSDIKLLNLGIGPIWLPFAHYIEWLLKVPYRYDKLFTGFVREGERLLPTAWVYYARILVQNSFPRTEVVGRMAEQAGLWTSAPLGRMNIYSIICKEYFNFVKGRVEKDRWLLARGPIVDSLEVERQRTGTEAQPLQLGPFSMEGWIKKLAGIRRDLVSDNMDSVFSAIKEQLKMELIDVSSGEHCLDWIIPERTVVKNEQTVSYSFGRLQYGELTIKGKSNQRILVCAYLEGPDRVNENLSGLIVSLGVYEELKKRSNNLSWTFLVLPGPVGFAAWCERNRDHWLNVICAMHLKMLGKDLSFSVQECSKKSLSFFDPFPRGGNPLKAKCDYPKFKNFCLCKVDTNEDALFPYAGYGTAQDNLESVRYDQLKTSRDSVLEFFIKQDSNNAEAAQVMACARYGKYVYR